MYLHMSTLVMMLKKLKKIVNINTPMEFNSIGIFFYIFLLFSAVLLGSFANVILVVAKKRSP